MAPKKMDNSKTDMKVIAEMLNEVSEQREMYVKLITESIYSEYCLIPETISDLLPIRIATINDIKENKEESITLCKKFIHDHLDMENSQSNAILSKTNDLNWLHDTMMELKEHNLELVKFDCQLNELHRDSQNALNDYYTYLASDEVKNARKERLEIMKNTINKTEDPKQKEELMESIKTIEKTINMSFFFDRLEELGQTEADRIKEVFFNDNLSRVIMKKYQTKSKRFGIAKDIHTHFLNLEEMYLPERYHVFNNIFLFGFIRFVAYCDPYNKTDLLYVKTLAGNISSLVYKKFEGSSVQEEFIALIQRFVSYFEPYRDEFEKNNIGSPTHPVRLKREAKREETIKQKLLSQLMKFGVDINGETQSDNGETKKITEMTSAELRDLLNIRLDYLIKEQQADIDKIDEKSDEENAESVDNETDDVDVSEESQSTDTCETTETN